MMGIVERIDVSDEWARNEAQSTCGSWAKIDGPVIEQAAGCWLTSVDGVRYFDATAGSGAVNLGHQHPLVTKALTEQLQLLSHTGCKIQNRPRTLLAKRLVELTFGRDAKCLPTVTGAEAVEAAIKVARAYTARKPIASLQYNYHGKTTGALSCTWAADLKRFSCLDDQLSIFLPTPSDDTVESIIRVMATIREQFERCHETGQLPAALFIEPIQSTEGVFVLPKPYLQQLAELARSYGTLVVFDEIYTGFGRTGSLFYYQSIGVVPDLILYGKGLANGLPISGVIGATSIIDALGVGVQTSTFSGNALVSAAGIAVLDLLLGGNTLSDVTTKGEFLLSALNDFARRDGLLSHVRGKGLMIGFEIRKDGEPRKDLANAFAKICLDNGLILFTGGYNGACVRITPPLTISDEEISFLLNVIATSCHQLAAR